MSMDDLRKLAILLLAFIGGGVILLVFGSWWSNRVPSRPAGVSQDAVFLWAPRVPFEFSRRGSWISCFESGGSTICKLSSIDGTTEYEGQFLPYKDQHPLSTKQVAIDGERTQDGAQIWIGDVFVPLVYLRNGDILIPASKYAQGVTELQKRQMQAPLKKRE